MEKKGDSCEVNHAPGKEKTGWLFHLIIERKSECKQFTPNWAGSWKKVPVCYERAPF